MSMSILMMSFAFIGDAPKENFGRLIGYRLVND